VLGVEFTSPHAPEEQMEEFERRIWAEVAEMKLEIAQKHVAAAAKLP
jgi:hypothetical protein